MMLAYGALAGIIAFGQQVTGADLLDQALSQDVSVEGIMDTAGRMAGLGVSATDAALIVAGAGLAYKLLQIIERIVVPRFETRDLVRRKELLEGWEDPHRRNQPPPKSAPPPSVVQPRK